MADMVELSDIAQNVIAQKQDSKDSESAWTGRSLEHRIQPRVQMLQFSSIDETVRAIQSLSDHFIWHL